MVMSVYFGVFVDYKVGVPRGGSGRHGVVAFMALGRVIPCSARDPSLKRCLNVKTECNPLNQSLNIGIIGAGGMGGRHALNLTHRVAAARVAVVMDADESRARQVAEACGGASVLTDAHQLIASDEVDAVLIAAPDRFHAELTLACIEAGKPVLCEKPLATSAVEAKKVVDAEAACGRRLVQLGFMREYDPAHRRVKQVCERAELGRLLVFRGVHINRLDGPVRSLEDVINNSAVHDIHSARWLMGDEIVRVHTSYVPGAPGRPDTARYALIQLQFAGGTLGVIELNADSDYGYEVDVEVTCEKGVVSTNSLGSPIVRRSNGRSQWIEDDWLQRFEEAYLLEARAWVQSLVEGRPAGPSAWDGYVSMVVVDACIESAKRGMPVEV